MSERFTQKYRTARDYGSESSKLIKITKREKLVHHLDSLKKITSVNSHNKKELREKHPYANIASLIQR